MTGEQERQTEMVVWRCNKCGSRSANGEYAVPHRVLHCNGEVKRIPVLEASKVEELVSAASRFLGVLDRGEVADDQELRDCLAAYHNTQAEGK